jgi:hypothetical protein
MYRRRLALFGTLATFLAAPLAAQPGGPLPQPLPLFPADNWWNADIRLAPVDPGSAMYLAYVGLDRGMHPDFGGDEEPGNHANPAIYGMVYVSVAGSQPLMPVTFVEYGDESDDGAPGRPPGYPIPDAAKTEPRWIEGGWPGDEDPGGDRHLLLVDRDRRILYELYRAFWNQDRERWEAGSGAVWPLDQNRRRPEGWTSADAAGLAILPGLVRWDEVFGSDPIRHAFRVTVRRTDGHVYPASHTAGDTSGALPMGARLRLKASVDLAGYPPPVRKIFEAMKTYGLIVADNGSDLYVTGTYDQRWDNDVLNPAFASIKARDFEVIELGWRPDGGSGAAPDAPRGLEARALSRRRVRLEWIDRSHDETSFVVEGRRGSAPFEELRSAGAGAREIEIGGLKPGSRYAFRIKARNSAGDSGYSNRAVVRTPS